MLFKMLPGQRYLRLTRPKVLEVPANHCGQFLLDSSQAISAWKLSRTPLGRKPSFLLTPAMDGTTNFVPYMTGYQCLLDYLPTVGTGTGFAEDVTTFFGHCSGEGRDYEIQLAETGLSVSASRHMLVSRECVDPTQVSRTPNGPNIATIAVGTLSSTMCDNTRHYTLSVQCSLARSCEPRNCQPKLIPDSPPAYPQSYAAFVMIEDLGSSLKRSSSRSQWSRGIPRGWQ
ncbi:uncharacterized protein B0T23DRAFT_224005 [Neurospora hispaniola]|uniref:Uncharacterized protein n=1 Tax=Neurospora hispaniola TaxID=588809 RepID=A0AAJ0I2Z5_9PEZI|nr:hypothetical protein B0T23DRAFT_224005 [Neurospora hispaniola]